MVLQKKNKTRTFFLRNAPLQPCIKRAIDCFRNSARRCVNLNGITAPFHPVLIRAFLETKRDSRTIKSIANVSIYDT